MSRRVSLKTFLALVVCFALCQPAVVVASTLSLTAIKSQPGLTGPNLRISHDSTTSRVPADRLSTETIKEKPKAESTEKTTKKKALRSRGSKTSKSHLKSATTARKVSHHHKYLGNREDCDACHQQCLIASLACIAISIATACPLCGGVCLVYQAACQATCNGTTACKNVSGGGSGSFEETPVIINNP